MAELLKDSIYSRENVELISGRIKKYYEEFDEQSFLKKVLNNKWESLELKERMRHITEVMHSEIKLDYKKSIKVLNKVSESHSGFEMMILPDYVELYGLESFDISVKALKKYTSCCSSEFAVRHFIINYETEMMKIMREWSLDKNHHVRRLASEGCRPRLPWAIALPRFKKDPSLIIPILENLKNDDSEYVRKSVANNINDISKDNPELALDVSEKWFGNSKNTDWIVKHGLRTLLKKGNERALKLLGVSGNINAELKNLQINSDKIKLNSELEFEFEIVNKEKSAENFRLEYQIEFMKSGGKHSAKVFKICEQKFAPGETKKIKRKFLFVNRSTRKLYPGSHIFTIIINGIKKDKFEIFLET